MTAKLVREIMVAAKLGGPDPDLNPRLAAAVEKAKKASVYRDTIERAIKKGSGQTDEKSQLRDRRLRGVRAPQSAGGRGMPHRIIAIGRRRRFANLLIKAGALGQPGSVAFFFNHVGVVEATHSDAIATRKVMRLKRARRRSRRSNRRKFRAGAQRRAVYHGDQRSRGGFKSVEGGGLECHRSGDSLHGQEFHRNNPGRAQGSGGFFKRAG